MTKKFKTILAGVLAIPMLALGASVFAPIAQPAYAVDEITDVQGGASAVKGQDQDVSLFGTDGIFTRIVNIILYVIGAVSVLMLVYGGIRYTISSGKSDDVNAAKDTIMYAIVGVIVAILAYAIVNFVLVNLLT